MKSDYPLPHHAGNKVYWHQLPGPAMAQVLAAHLRKHTQESALIVTADPKSAEALQTQLQFFAPDLSFLYFPDREILPYDHFSPHQDLISERLTCLSQLLHSKRALVITSVASTMQRVSDKTHLGQHSFAIRSGDNISPQRFRDNLVEQGYIHVPQVLSHGEFALRGALLDVYPMGAELPIRIEWNDDDIDSIRDFDPETQLSLTQRQQLLLLPAREFPLTEAAIKLFRERWREQFPGNPLECPMYQAVSKGLPLAGVETYFPLLCEQTTWLFDYLPENCLLWRTDSVDDALTQYWQDIEERYRNQQIDRHRPLLAPNALFLNPDVWYTKAKAYPQYVLSVEPTAKPDNIHYNFDFEALANLTVDIKKQEPLSALQTWLDSHPGKTLFAAESKGRIEVLRDLLAKADIHPHYVDNWAAYMQASSPFNITLADWESGYYQTSTGINLISEAALLGSRIKPSTRTRKSKNFDPEQAIKHLAELVIGSPVVHIDYGIGRFEGLQTLTIGDVTNEYLTLSYAGDDKLYVPVASLHVISRYSGIDAEHAPLTKLGTGQWEKAKKKAAEDIRDVAAELLVLYAKRAAKPGHALTAKQEDYQQFAAQFAFETTPDQQQTIEAVLTDMAKSTPMDRLVCGDVGFGKTEVAMRAAFVAVMAGKQVAVLTPTTLLAEQHLQTFRDRFAEWPIKVHALSRFRGGKESLQILKSLAEGGIDIVIGTHKLLGEQVQFKDLGLLIIDEEHRFGVTHKERLKTMSTDVHVLTLTATPIPRTLNMAVSGLRDLSIIATPPLKRLTIKTFVHERSISLIREAILRELLRGGQVFFLHNDVNSIGRCADELKQLVPEATIDIGHGQMSERQLEQVMINFYHQRFQILVCTTIIETGIDIPTANTIIIDDADHFGIAQLHQLRGRVGRSHHQAYAYLFTPPNVKLSTNAQKRLETIAMYDDLGIGFTLASHDLEIRGAGELLGDEQSGNIQAIGFSLYQELLDRAIASLRIHGDTGFHDLLPPTTDIDLRLSALIPEDYVGDVHERLMLYKRINSIKTIEELPTLKAEFIDRFGTLPLPTLHLFAIAELKLCANTLGIKKIDAHANGGRIEFHPKPNIDPAIIFQLIQQKSSIFKLEGGQTLKYQLAGEAAPERIKQVDWVLQQLSSQPNLSKK